MTGQANGPGGKRLLPRRASSRHMTRRSTSASRTLIPFSNHNTTVLTSIMLSANIHVRESKSVYSNKLAYLCKQGHVDGSGHDKCKYNHTVHLLSLSQASPGFYMSAVKVF